MRDKVPRDKICLKKGDALVVVDMQEDFMDGGALPVTGARALVEPVNETVACFVQKGLSVIFTRDFHPPAHCSFVDEGGKWPMHCVKGTKGAEFAKGLFVPRDSVVISKATENDREAYSGFQETSLEQILKKQGVKRLFVSGVATEYCVFHTVMDALMAGFEVVVLLDLIAPVIGEDGEKALELMAQKGARLAAASHLT